jgi:hypothetical protein
MTTPDTSPRSSTSEPVALYEGPQLKTFRGYKLIALVAVSVGIGVALHARIEKMQAASLDRIHVGIEAAPPPSTPRVVPNAKVAWPVTLRGSRHRP